MVLYTKIHLLDFPNPGFPKRQGHIVTRLAGAAVKVRMGSGIPTTKATHGILGDRSPKYPHVHTYPKNTQQRENTSKRHENTPKAQKNTLAFCFFGGKYQLPGEKGGRKLRLS